jgi:hypothetical protein
VTETGPEESPAHLKVELSLHGLRVDAALRAQLSENGAPAVLDLLLPQDVWVQVAIDERWTTASPFALDSEKSRFRLHRGEGAPLDVRVLAPPAFYSRRTRNGTQMSQVAEVHGNFVAVDPGAVSGFASRGTPCAFCRGAGSSGPSTLASVADVVETVRAAFDEGVADFVYFHSRCSDAPDGGMSVLGPYIKAVKKHFDTLVAAQLQAPVDLRDVDHTYALGVDAVNYNLEIYDPDVLARYCPGRIRRVGREHLLETLRYAATIYPRGTVWTELVIGLEALDSTRAAIDALATMGVLPVLSVVGPAARAASPGLRSPTPAELAPVYAHLYETVKRTRIPMTWVRDLPIGITPLDARFFVHENERVGVASFYRSRLGTLAARGLSRLRRRLRVKTVSDSLDSSHL